MYCSKCGNRVEDSVNFCPICGHLENESLSFAAPYVNFSDAVSICLKKYFKFSGRASASEFWWFFLLAVSSKRLHDINKSG